MLAVLGPQPHDLPQEHEFGPERPRLLEGAKGEVRPAHAPGEAGIVADQRARPGLSANGLAFDDEHP